MKNAASRPRSEIRVGRRYRAPGTRVFDAWLDPAIARQWLFATASRPLARAEIDARVAGSFRFVERHRGTTIEHGGRYVEIVLPRRLVFTLSVEDQPDVITQATIVIAATKTGCTLTLAHEGVPPDFVEHTRLRWAGMLYGLGVTLDATARRPVDLTRKPSAAALPIPVSWSLR